MNNDLKDITNHVIDILKKIQPFSNVIDEEHSELPLTGSVMNFSDYEMAYIVLELMELYKIEFDNKDFENYKFNSIKSISEIVYNRINL